MADQIEGLLRDRGLMGDGYRSRFDDSLFDRKPFSSSIDNAFRSFGHPQSSFENLEEAMKDLRMEADRAAMRGSGGGSSGGRRTPPLQPRSYLHHQSHIFGAAAAAAGGPPKSSSLRNLEGLSSGRFTTEKTTTRRHEFQSSTSSVNSGGSGGGSGGVGRGERRAPPPPGESVRDMSTADRFCITLDISDFSPEEIKVKTVGNTVVIEGKQEVKDGHGRTTKTSRNFNRTWTLPNDVDPNAVTSRLTSSGQLSVEAPRLRKSTTSTTKRREHLIHVSHEGGGTSSSRRKMF